MPHFDRIDRATRSPVYREYASLIGATIARAAMAATAAEREQALAEVLALQAEQAQIVTSSPHG